MIRGNTSDFIGHPLPKVSISDSRMDLPPRLGPGPPPPKSGAELSSALGRLFQNAGSPVTKETCNKMVPPVQLSFFNHGGE